MLKRALNDETRAQLLDMGFAERQFEAYLNKGFDATTPVTILVHQQGEAEARLKRKG